MTHVAAPALGAHLVRQNGTDGVRFAVWAPEAEAVEVQLFDAGRQSTGSVSLDAQGNGLWSRFVPGLTAGQAYGLRAHGPWNPAAGQRFNPARLLIDPWALGLAGDTARLALQVAHAVADPRGRRTGPTRPTTGAPCHGLSWGIRPLRGRPAPRSHRARRSRPTAWCSTKPM